MHMAQMTVLEILILIQVINFVLDTLKTIITVWNNGCLKYLASKKFMVEVLQNILIGLVTIILQMVAIWGLEWLVGYFGIHLGHKMVIPVVVIIMTVFIKWISL